VKLKSVLLVAAALAVGSILPVLLGMVLGLLSAARGPAPHMTIRYVDAPSR
jgi:hypothetical protein